jgi:hypothetical protein
VIVPDSGTVTSITALPSREIVGVGGDSGLWLRSTLTSPWVKVPNSTGVIAVTRGRSART